MSDPVHSQLGCYGGEYNNLQWLSRASAELDGCPYVRSHQWGRKVHQLDFPVWIDFRDPQGGLWWFIREAGHIDLHLQGASAADLRFATVDAEGAKPSRCTQGLPCMTSWKINQVYWRGLQDRTMWHTGGKMTVEDATSAEVGRVPRDRILEGAPC